MSEIKESDLYPHVKNYLEKLGYSVKGEIAACDVAAVRGDELIAVELKQSINMKLILQAVERQEACDSVYIAVPVKGSGHIPDMKAKHKLITRLCLGLMIVRYMKHRVRVEIVCHPKDHRAGLKTRRRRAIIREFHARRSDTTAGGTRGKIISAYREEALIIASLLKKHGELSPAVCKKLGAAEKAGSILYSNHYGWFERCGHGLYRLHEAGHSALAEYKDILPDTSRLT
ncbi:DUF2161 family putative PD-(D/E)XK-type phosphodiesterase [Spirochaeta dissipatitropha]